MSVRTHNILDSFARIDQALAVAKKKRDFDCGLLVAKEVIGLLGVEDVSVDLKSFPRLKTNPSWTRNAPDYEDRKASYVLADNNPRNIDFKLFWVNKPAKRIIANIVALTPNFEDEPFYANKNVGIDFVLPETADRLIIVLSNNYKIRVLELHEKLSNTQKKIFEKWRQEFDFGNKAQVHRILWDSFDIQPLNKEFYLEISGLFNDLVQHLEKKNVLDKKHRSQFVNRLIGRIIFCWFLRKKEIVSEDVGYFDAQGRLATEYYQDKLETLFFKVLNTPIEERPIGIDDKTPFLNGGLFEPKESDLFGKDELSFPADYFERFYKFLGYYNFTTDESTSDFQQVAIDPEMLGRIFENLLAEETEETGEQARKAKGAFYTPREIVDYMCRESLRMYISEKLGEDGRKGEVLQILFDKKEHELDSNILVKLSTYKNRIIEALDEIKIIDPACGSGAFPIGMLQIVLSIYERLDTRLDHYKTKLGIIKNNIYGVDIEPMAVEISRLRTWLSLVVDSIIKPSEKNKGIEELPNLDFKFVCANSLILLDQAQELYDNKEIAKQMQTIRERYFKTNSQRIKDKMKRDFEDVIKKNQSMFVSHKQKQLLTYHPFDSDNVCSFFDTDFLFGVSKFDIVIANPPYLDSENMVKSGHGDMREIIQRKYVLTKGNWDIYIAFFEMGFNVLGSSGILTFITPDKWISKPFGDQLRKSKIDHMAILLRAGRKVFESAKVDSIISFFSNRKLDNIKIYDFDGSQFIFKRTVDKASLKSPFALDHLFSSSLGLINKIEQFKGRVSDFGNCENACATSDAYKLAPFISDLTDNDFDPKKYFKIINTGTIGKFSMRWGIREMTYLKHKYLRPVVNKKSFLDAFPNSYGKKAGKPKIILKGLNLLDACIDQEGIVIPGKTTLLIPGDDINKLKFLLAILNTKTPFFYIKERYPASSYNQGTTFTREMIDNLPVPTISEIQKQQLIDVVDKILARGAIKTEEQQAMLDKDQEYLNEMVMNLYGLTSDEIEMVKKS